MRWNRILTVMLLAFLAGATCFSTRTRSSPEYTRHGLEAPVTLAPEVVMDGSVHALLSLLHYRLAGHLFLPSHEWPVCLRGEMHGDTLHIYDVSAAVVRKFGAYDAEYQCITRPDLVGVWHNHVPRGIRCAHSPVDSSEADKKNYRISLVSCNEPMELDVWLKN